MRELWESVLETANQIAVCPVVRETAATLVRAHASLNPSMSTVETTWESNLSLLVGRGNFRYHEQPLRFAQLAQMDPLFAQIVGDPAGKSLFERLNQGVLASALIVEWLRSRVPGYPTLRAPQIAARINEVTVDDYPWSPQFRPMKLQLNNPPVQIAGLLGGQERILASLRRVGALLQASQPFRQLSGARAALTEESQGELNGLCALVRNECSDEVIDAIEPLDALRRLNIRNRNIRRICDQVSNSATSSYIAAFDDALGLLRDVTSTLVYLAVWRRPLSISEPARLSRSAIGEERIDVVTDDPRAGFLFPRMLVVLPDVTTGETSAIFVTRATMSFSGPSSFGGHELLDAGAVLESVGDDIGIPWLTE